MSDSFQDVYAENLQHAVYGYPLRMPEPMSTLPENYQDNGLQIGDLGVVDNKGQFDVLFNICKRSDNSLHKLRGVPKGFQPVHYDENKVKTSDSENAISAGPIFSQGIKQTLQPKETSSADYYEFDSCTRTGAILILPHGATSAELLSTQQFREVAMKNALDWYEFANKCCDVQHHNRSLYLITGFYKARSWCLGSFNNPTDATGKILARRDNTNPNIYRLECTFPADRRASKGGDDMGRMNQTVFITGFKITVSNLLWDPIVTRVTESETTWAMLVRLLSSCLRHLRGFSGGHKPHATISVKDSPSLSQPFHPSDIINRFLLSKKPNARVAITHDNEWMGMMKEGLTHEDLLQEDRLETFLMRYYTISVDSDENATAFLEGKTDDTMGSVPAIVDPHDTSSELEFSPPLTPSLDNPWIVITRIRAQHILSGLKRMPVGFYVLVQFDAAQRRTQNKFIWLNDNAIEWEDAIQLPSEAFGKVQFTVYASFELEPMLGNGEALYSSEILVEKLVGGTYLIPFSPGESGSAVPDPSLLITLGRRYSNHPVVAPGGDDSNLNSDTSEALVLVHETVSGQEALLRYYNEYQREDLDKAVQHFDCAWQNCPMTHSCRAVALVNLARTKFISYQIDPTSGNLDEYIQLYRQALNLRPPGHPDTPATTLQLAQILLFRYEKEGRNESDADEINDLITKSKSFADNTHVRRAADLVLETFERCRVLNSGSSAELDQLVENLERSRTVPPDGYFDIPQRLINLSTALWRRCTKHGEPNTNDLDRLLDINNQALQLLPGRQPDRLPVLGILAAVLWRLFEIHGDLSYLKQLIAPSEEALQLVPEGHPGRPYWVVCSISYAAEKSERLGDTAFEAQKYDEAIEHYSRAISLLPTPS